MLCRAASSIRSYTVVFSSCSGHRRVRRLKIRVKLGWMHPRNNRQLTVVFGWEGCSVAWDRLAKRWIINGGRTCTFKELQQIKTERKAENPYPRNPRVCEQIMEKLLANGAPDGRLKTFRRDLVHDFKTALHKLGVPRQTINRHFSCIGSEDYKLAESCFQPLPDWAKAQVDPVSSVLNFGKSGKESIESWFENTHPHQELTSDVVGLLEHSSAAVEIVGPPGSRKACILTDLVNHFAQGGKWRPIFILCPSDPNIFFKLLAARLHSCSYPVDPNCDDPGGIAQSLSNFAGVPPLLILRSVNQYFGPALEEFNGSRSAKHWLIGLETILGLGRASLVVTSTVSIAHQTRQCFESSWVQWQTFYAGSAGWDKWLDETRLAWESAGRTPPPLSWDALGFSTRGQARALLQYLQRVTRDPATALSELNADLRHSIREIFNQLPRCCCDTLQSVLLGHHDGSSTCLNVLLDAGIVILREGKPAPSLDVWWRNQM
jgi:hypothetical protein